jgi:hypothetical protein
VILMTPDEVETWMTGPQEALKLQKPLSNGALQIVARGVKEDMTVRPSANSSNSLCDITLVVDAGLGAPSHAARALLSEIV